jgi:hypothetical protein
VYYGTRLWKVKVGPAPTNWNRARKGPVFLCAFSCARPQHPITPLCGDTDCHHRAARPTLLKKPTDLEETMMMTLRLIITAAAVTSFACMNGAAAQSGAGTVLTGKAAFGDFHTDAPGVRRHITATDVPPPFSSESPRNQVKVVNKPADAQLDSRSSNAPAVSTSRG